MEPKKGMERNPPWAPPLTQREIYRLYVTDARGIIDEGLINDVGYGLYARCESILIATQAYRGRVTCPRCTQIIHHNHAPDAQLVCSQCSWQKSWKAYKKTLKGKHLQAEGIEIFLKEYIAQFPKASDMRRKMLLIDRLIHRWHWEHENNLQRPGAANLVEGKADDTIEFLNELTYSENSTPGLARMRDEWRQKHRIAAQIRFGGIDAILSKQLSSDPAERLDALSAMMDIGVDTGIAIDRLTQALRDSNRKIRKEAAWCLLQIDVAEERKVREFIPLLLPLLNDPSGRVRGSIAQLLAHDWAEHVPLESAAWAVLNTKDGILRVQMEELLRSVLEKNNR